MRGPFFDVLVKWCTMMASGLVLVIVVLAEVDRNRDDSFYCRNTAGIDARELVKI